MGNLLRYLFILILILNFSFKILSFSIILLICFSVFGKSSLLIFNWWLPIAIERPTPVSSLLHSSTIVVARVTLSIVLSYSYNFNIILVLGTFGILTSIFSGIFATFWLDLKKVVAFSTTSQLRLICFSITLFNFGLIIFHIIFHAFSKAIIFISTRLVLHTFNSSQDSRKISNFTNFSMNSFKIFLILGSFSLIRVFIFICFYSKDTFLFSLLLDSLSLNNFVLFRYSAVITLVYSLNLILWVFNFGSNIILPLLLVYNRKIFNHLLILIFLLVLISFNLLILNFNFSLFNSFIRKFLPIILLATILPKILNFNFNHLCFNIFNISNFHILFSNKF